MSVSQERPSPRKIDPWTSPDIDRWLITAFRAMPYTPIYAPRGNTLEAVDPNQPDATFDIVAFSGTVLGNRSIECRVLLVWARVMATRGTIGGSIAEFCRETGLERRQFDRIRLRASSEVARVKNLTDRPRG